jgi:transcription elongation factor GreA
MAAQRPPLPHAESLVDAPRASPGLSLTAADFDALVRELDLLRSRHRAEFARSLRDARTFGSPGEDDDVLTVFEEAVVDEARIAQLEDLLRTASVVDDDLIFDGRAGLGCAVRVVDARGRTSEYTLIGRRLQGSPRDHFSLASPVGEALAGTSAGDIVRVALPNGRDRELRVIEVTSRVTDGLAGTAQAA